MKLWVQSLMSPDCRQASLSGMTPDPHLLINDSLRMTYNKHCVVINKRPPEAASPHGAGIDPGGNIGFTVKLVFQLKCVFAVCTEGSR